MDSTALIGWNGIVEKLAMLHNTRAMEHVTCGYLVERTKDYIAVTTSLGGEETGFAVGDTMQIPMGVVRKVTVLRGKVKGV